MIIWLTGQPGSGKTTIAQEFISESIGRFINIDGDDLREIFDNKDYSEVGRRKNIELAQNIAEFLHNKGFHPIVSLVSPYRDQREKFKEKVGKEIFEVYVYTTKIRGREQYFVKDYQEPTDNYLSVCTDDMSPEACVSYILTQIREKV
jgi:adenylylsulfate kinase-like enzyme